MNKPAKLILSLGALLMMAGCSANGGQSYTPGTGVKVGLICIHDDSSTYDKNFIDSMNAAVESLGSKVSSKIIKTGVAEGNECYIAAKDLVKQGCNVIFADSFGHEAFMLKAAKEFPNVTFCHATGTQAKTANQSNYHNAFASIYEGRYLAGYAAGLKLQSMVSSLKANNFDDKGNIKLGYVGAFPYAEVVSGYTSWFLGVQAVVPNVVMDVQYTREWYTLDGERDAANMLITKGAALVSQHADSMGAPNACAEANVPNVTYNLFTDGAISYSKIDWAPYYKAVINAIYDGKAIDGEFNNNWTGTLATGSVVWDVRDPAAKAATALIEAELKNGTRKVFDCSKFTVDGKHLTTYLADVDDLDDNFQHETEAIKTEGNLSFFNESAGRSAPYFDIRIDGITELNPGNN